MNESAEHTQPTLQTAKKIKGVSRKITSRSHSRQNVPNKYLMNPVDLSCASILHDDNEKR